MTVGQNELYEETKESLERIQKFNVENLPRESSLGTQLNFLDVVPPAQQLIDLYKRLSVTALKDFPDTILTSIKDNANNHYNLFTQIIEFEPTQQDPSTVRTNLINNVTNAYTPAFQQLHPFISYSLHRSADFQRLDTEARAKLQAIEDESSKITNSLVEKENSAKTALEEIRNVAAEAGVTREATHFKNEFEHHNTEAAKWQERVIWLSIILVLFAVMSLFLHEIPILNDKEIYNIVQLSVSKLLIFSVITYMLFLSSRNFFNHKHNAIVNKHRENALLTYNALVEASGDGGVRDAVLLQAASCIFSPQSTGYTPTNEIDVSNQKSMIEIFSKPILQPQQDAGK